MIINESNIVKNDIKKGEKVRLQWTGSYRLPHWLHFDWAEVLEITRQGNFKIQADSETTFPHTVKIQDICSHELK